MHGELVQERGINQSLWVQLGKHSQQILLPSAVHLEERLTVSQSVPEPASSQTDTHSLGFLSVADAAASSREALRLNPSSDRAVVHPAGVLGVGGSNPSLAT